MKKICYFGSGEFSRVVLEGLLRSCYKCSIEAVVTRSDKEKGRGRHLAPTPVKELALLEGIEVMDTEDIKSESFIEALKGKGFDLFIVCDYGKMVPKSVFELPPMKTIGVHPSVLPKYRGPSPIHFALLNCDNITGTTVFYVNERMDAGDILIQREVIIEDTDDYFSLSQKLALASVEAIIEFLNTPGLTPIPQDESKATFTKIITKEDARIDWSKDAKYIFGQVRAFVGWPKAYCWYKGKIVKILKVRYRDEELDGKFGEILDVSNTIKVKAGKGIVEVFEVLPESSKPMDARSFVNGYRVKVGDTFE